MKKLNSNLKSYFLLILMTGFFSDLRAQNYGTAVGVRLGFPFSASLKHFVSESNAFEAFVGTHGKRYSYGFGEYGWRWWVIGGAYQKHQTLDLTVDGLENLQWYWGAGASTYFWTFDDYYTENYSSSSFGVQGYIGLDYEFDEIPLNITLDWVPTVFLNGFGSGFGGGYGSVGVRYVLR